MKLKDLNPGSEPQTSSSSRRIINGVITSAPMSADIEPASQTSTEENNESSPGTVSAPNQSGDVWYRRPLQVLFLRGNQSVQSRLVPYERSFRQRTLRPAGIPIQQVEGLHELIKEPYVHYSPFVGMIFAHNNLIANLYRYGNSTTEPIVGLIQQLFHVLPGGEVQPSHIERNAAALVTPGMVGALISNVFEESRNAGVIDSALLAQRISETLQRHPDYQLQLRDTQAHVIQAQNSLAALERAQIQAEPIRQEILRLEGTIIKRTKHKLKKLQQQLANSPSEDHPDMSQIFTEQQPSLVEQYEETVRDAQMQVDQLRTQLVTNLDVKQARKAIKRARLAVEQQDSSLAELGENLAKCWLTYCTNKSNSLLPPNLTEVVLVAYLWQKYDTISALEPYFAALQEIGALTVSIDKLLQVVQENSLLDSPQSPRAKPRRRRIRSRSDQTRAVIVSMSKPGSSKRPPIVPFSYITWAAYSEFPDCGETALRNLLNQVLYNPRLGRFDYQVLEELRGKVFPSLSEGLITFYRQRHHPHEACSHDAAREWIQVVSGLNSSVESKTHVRYRREREQKNIASPLSNLLVVFNKLFGIEEETHVERGIERVVQEIHRRRPDAITVKVDTDAIRLDGFGILKVTDGSVQYELQSYKPVHFGFVQSDSAHADKSDYRTFRSLLRHVQCQGSFSNISNPADLEQMAVASLLVPYQLQRHSKVSRIKLPTHMVLLFADLDTEQQKRHVMKTDSSLNNTASDVFARSLLQGIESYHEPEFQPQRRNHQ